MFRTDIIELYKQFNQFSATEIIGGEWGTNVNVRLVNVVADLCDDK